MLTDTIPLFRFESSDFCVYHDSGHATEYDLMLEDFSLNICYVVLRSIPRPHTIKAPFVDWDMVHYTINSGGYESSSGQIQLQTFPQR
jgi:hypothetical protein